MQSFFKEHFQPIFSKVERCCMKDDICLLDHHQKSHWNTITNWTKKGMINRVLQLKARSTVFWRSTSCWIFQTNRIQTQSNLWSNGETREYGTFFLWREEKRPVHKRLLVSVCKKNLVLQTERGNPWRVKTIASCMFTIERGNPWNQAQTHTHTVQEFGSPEHRDTASSNANKFNLAIDEENIDFNISGVPNAMVKRSHGINVHNLIQKIENHPQRKALQSDLQQHRPFNPFSKESKDATKAAGNTELCEIVDVEPKTQCSMPDVLGRWHRLVHVWTLLARWYNRKQEVHLIRAGSLLYPELLHQEGPATRSQVREERRLQRIPHGKTTSKEVSKETKGKHPRSIYPWHVVQKDDDRVGSLWRSHPWNGQTCKRRPQS